MVKRLYCDYFRNIASFLFNFFFTLVFNTLYPDKTLNLLKEGVKEYSQNSNTSQMEFTELPLTKITSREMKPERSKQMILNSKLQLESSDKIISVCTCF